MTATRRFYNAREVYLTNILAAGKVIMGEVKIMF